MNEEKIAAKQRKFLTDKIGAKRRKFLKKKNPDIFKSKKTLLFFMQPKQKRCYVNKVINTLAGLVTLAVSLYKTEAHLCYRLTAGTGKMYGTCLLIIPECLS